MIYTLVRKWAGKKWKKRKAMDIMNKIQPALSATVSWNLRIRSELCGQC